MKTTAAASATWSSTSARRKVTVERNDRFEDYTTNAYEI
jgi:hypothetical protein